MAYIDHFGFVEVKDDVSFSGGSLAPSKCFDDSVKWVREHEHPEKFVYPPVTTLHRGSDHQGWVEVPQSRRGALLHAMPVSHELRLNNVVRDRDVVRCAEGAFIMHLFGFVTGYRCQFEEWWLDGRVNTKPDTDHNPPRPNQMTSIIDTAFRQWNSWPTRERRVAINALYLHTRVPSLELTWEGFHNQYLVLDALFSLIRHSNHGAATQKKVKHRDRITWMCQLFGIPIDAALVSSIVDVRNDLFHQALWVGGMPGESGGEKGWDAYLSLRALCARLAYAALGHKGEYVSSPWWSRMTYFLDVTPAI